MLSNRHIPISQTNGNNSQYPIHIATLQPLLILLKQATPDSPIGILTVSLPQPIGIQTSPILHKEFLIKKCIFLINFHFLDNSDKLL